MSSSRRIPPEDESARESSSLATVLLVGPALLAVAVALAVGGFVLRFVPLGASKEGAKVQQTFGVAPINTPFVLSLKGRIVDGRDAPVAGVQVVNLGQLAVLQARGGPLATSDADGRFQIDVEVIRLAQDQTVHVQMRLREGKEFELAAIPGAEGEVLLKLPTLLSTTIQGPEVVAPDELAGVVVDPDGRPIDKVDVDAWDWRPGNQVETDREGRFRLPHLGKGEKVEVRLSKPGYEPRLFLQQPTGVPGWVVVMGSRTCFEGRVLAPDGAPVADALVRGDSGPMRMAGGMRTECWTEVKSGEGGRYRLFVEPGIYDLQVRVPGVGLARLRQRAIPTDQVIAVDLHLEPRIDFVARAVDRETGKPVAGVTLSTWEQSDSTGISDANGWIRIPGMMPGPFSFGEVEAKGYTRWWSDACLKEWNRYTKKSGGSGFQRNFDDLDFDVQRGMKPVTIMLERGVTVRGRVVDPDGKPVAGATAAPALTGSGNSLTGDTRFSVVSAADGRFEMLLPASGGVSYNLVAHDGKYQEWRTWANGTLPPFQSTPGQVIEGVVLRLTRPGTVSGRVVDARGKPVAERCVCSKPTARDENRYYDPTTLTGPDGTFALKFVRPGENDIQVAPFWLRAEQAPPGTSETVTVKAGQTVAGVELRAAPER